MSDCENPQREYSQHEACMKTEYHSTTGDDQSPSFTLEAPSFYLYAKSNPNPILITNMEREIQYVNAAWEGLTGYASGEVLGRNPRFLSSGKTPPELYKAVWETLMAGNSFESEEFIDRKKDGSEFSLRSVFFPIVIRGSITYLVQVLDDISKRKELEKRKDTFINTASHELRAPLQVIMMSLDLLKHELESAPAATMDILRTLQDETGRLVQLLNNLLDVSTMHSGELHTQKEKYNLGQLLHRVVDELGTTFATHILSVEIPEDTQITATYDEARITQVLTNLVSNAVKYSPQANRVIIHLDVRGNEAEIRIQDFGVGIGKEDQQKIFDVFYRVKSRGHVEGTGLGLFITAQIIEAHQGRLWVTSELDKGSTFHFSLPLN